MSLSGVSSYGTRKTSSTARFRNIVCFIIAGLLAFAHTVISPNGNLAVQEPLANEVPAIVPAIKATIISKNQSTPTPFVHDRSQPTFGSHKRGQGEQFPSKATRDSISLIAKSRAELRLAKIHAEAMEGANVHVLMHAESVEIQAKQLINVHTDEERKSAPSIWKLLASSFVPALVKAAGHN